MWSFIKICLICVICINRLKETFHRKTWKKCWITHCQYSCSLNLSSLWFMVKPFLVTVILNEGHGCQILLRGFWREDLKNYNWWQQFTWPTVIWAKNKCILDHVKKFIENNKIQNFWIWALINLLQLSLSQKP